MKPLFKHSREARLRQLLTLRNRHNAATLARKQYTLTRVGELQEEQLAIHQQATAEAAANAQVTIESLITEAEAARAKAMEEKGGAAAAVSALIAKAKLAGMWREKIDQHNTGTGAVPVLPQSQATVERPRLPSARRQDSSHAERPDPRRGQRMQAGGPLRIHLPPAQPSQGHRVALSASVR